MKINNHTVWFTRTHGFILPSMNVIFTWSELNFGNNDNMSESHILSTIRMRIIKFRSIFFCFWFSYSFYSGIYSLFTVFWSVALWPFHFQFLLFFSTSFSDNILFHFHIKFIRFIAEKKRKKYSLLFIMNSKFEWASAQITKSRLSFKNDWKKSTRKRNTTNTRKGENRTVHQMNDNFAFFLFE